MPAASRTLTALLLAAVIVLAAALAWRTLVPPPPDPRLIDLAVRSTLSALPTQTPVVVEVTRVVAPSPTPTMAPTATPHATATPLSSAPILAGAAAFVAPAAVETPSESDPAPAEEPPEAAPDAPAPPAAPASVPASAGCASGPGRAYDAIPVDSAPIDHPDSIHGDLNLGQRGWTPVDATLAVVDINGPADGDPPQLAAIFADGRLPAFTSAAQVYDWNWGCGAHGCRGDLLTHHEVMLLGLGASAGEAVRIPARAAQIYGGGYKAMVLYAEPSRLTLGYTREDSVANGYAIHLEGLCVDPGLVALYRQQNAAGRGSLPALREGETLGAAAGELRVAVRDRGEFFDPRSRKDWWRGF